MSTPVGGTFIFKVDGRQYRVKGSFTYNLGYPKREPEVGPDGLHGFTIMPQPSRIEGEITDATDVDKAALLTLRNATVTLELINGKTVVMREAFYTGDGDTTTERGAFQIVIHGAPEAEELGGRAAA